MRTMKRSRWLSLGLWLVIACQGESLRPEEVVRQVQEGLAAGDESVLARYVREDLIQHSASLADGRAGMRAELGARVGLRIHRVLRDGDRVATHSSFTGRDGVARVALDVYRVQDGQLSEHWDAVQVEVPASMTVHGRSMVDGPTAVMDPERTEANRAWVNRFFDEVWLGGQVQRLPEFVGPAYQQHNPYIKDGLQGIQQLAAQLEQAGLGFGYTRSPLRLAEGNFVLVGSEGFFGPIAQPPFAVFYDLFRLEGGQLVEHWDVVPMPAPDPKNLPHGNGLF